MSRRALRAAAAFVVVVGPVALAITAAAPASAEDVTCVGTTPSHEVAFTDRQSQPLLEMDVAEAQRLARARGKEPGQGVVVAVLDSGVAAAEPAIPVIEHVPLTGSPPEYYHGTAVASLIAGQDRADGGPVGIAPAAQILDVQIYDTPDAEPGEGIPITSDQVVAGLTAVLDEISSGVNVRVVTMAFVIRDDPRLQPLIDQLWRSGAIVVAPTGNRPRQEDVPNPLLAEFEDHRAGEDAAPVVRPAGYEHVLAVSSSMTGYDDDARATDFVLENSRTDVAAPTANAVAYSVNGGTCVLDIPATSWAAAEVSGVLALLQSVYDESPAQATRRLKVSADGRPDLRTRLVGAGEVQPVAALTRPLTMNEDGELEQTVVQDQPTRVTAPVDEPDLLAATRRNAVWWGLLCGGVLILALVVRPVLARRRPH